MPPTNNHQNSIGCILAKSDGTIMGVTTKNLQIDPRDIYPRNIQMHMPVIPQAIKANALAISTHKKATTLKGVTLSRQDLVTFVHKIGHWSKREMKWMARLSDQGLGIDNFPLTEKEVDKYYPTECDCCPRGHHHRDPVSHTNFQAPNARQNRTHDTTHHASQLRNTTIGEQVGIDLYEYLGKKKLNARDKA